MENVSQLSTEDFAALLEQVAARGVQVQPAVSGGGTHSAAYYSCVATHSGKCGDCSETGVFTPCG